tara:strand:- start:3079 stop:3219 length:141 start_codon:yes stop_codon:yes gene_type:complete
MKNFFCFFSFTAVFYIAISSSFDSMTKQDCKMGIQAACDQLVISKN